MEPADRSHRFRYWNWLKASRRSAFIKSPGGKASSVPCARVSPACGCALLTGIGPAQRSGCSSSGQRARSSRPVAGCRRCRRTAFKQLVATAKARWRIEHDYLELKSELGHDHFEGRGWRGFHHHASLCIAAYGFLMLERLSGLGKKRRSIPRTSPARRFPAARGPGGCSATSPGPSPPCATGWCAPSPERLHNALAAACATSMGNAFSNTVGGVEVELHFSVCISRCTIVLVAGVDTWNRALNRGCSKS
jgi:hypothetical protein